MLLKRTRSESPSRGLLKKGLAGLAVIATAAGLSAGCLDRPVVKAEPKTNNVYVDQIKQSRVDKIDLLFMIDNSISMADKQQILQDAVPVLVRRLVTPACVDADGNPTGQYATATGQCPDNSEPEFTPIDDIHVGVITSSLGSHGAPVNNTCSRGTLDENDRGWLLGKVERTELSGDNNSGFLQWDPNQEYTPPGQSNADAFVDSMKAMVQAAGEHGCGYEASLEAWYRFLVDPQPPRAISINSDGIGYRDPDPSNIDTDLLAQREAFLRSDSLVAIIMLTDENDCSIRDDNYGHLISTVGPANSPFRMFRSRQACLSNPNDDCCFSCGESDRNNCTPKAQDAECQKGTNYGGNEGLDSTNLRCWQQKRRFGFDMLYPVSRYVNGLRNLQVWNDTTNAWDTNGLLAARGGKPARDPNLVFLAGIVGVPWQDIATPESLAGGGLRYLTAQELGTPDDSGANRWDVILGTPVTYDDKGDPTNDAPVLPLDPFMIETPIDRTTLDVPQANPITGDQLQPSSSNNPQANPINGHEQVAGSAPDSLAGADDLQYACIFPLGETRTCVEPTDDTPASGCDCFADDAGHNRPLCQPPGGGATGTTQYFAKAYPGTRHLEVLKSFGENAIVASICPKITDDTSASDYGYNPAVAAIIDRLKEALKGRCLPRPLSIQPDGRLPCAVVETTFPTENGCAACDGSRNRLEASEGIRPAVIRQLRDTQQCDGAGQAACDSICMCEIKQSEGEDLTHCQEDLQVPTTPGYCYVTAGDSEPKMPIGNQALLDSCPAESKRLLRFVGDNTPANGSTTFVACLGAGIQ